jgi:hypothetical protein
MFSQMIEAHERFRLELLAKSGVIGVAVGYRNSDGDQSDELALVALVEQKKPIEELAPDDLVPREMEGARTDVMEVGVLRANLGTRDRWRPTVPCGVSIGHPQVTAGTLGYMVRDSATGQALILSNNHVLAHSNGANIGDEIIQPGSTDGGLYPRDSVARLKRFWRLYWTDEVGAIVPPAPTPITPPPNVPTTPTQPTTPDTPDNSTPPAPPNLPELPIIDPNLPYGDVPSTPSTPTTPTTPSTPTTPTTPEPPVDNTPDMPDVPDTPSIPTTPTTPTTPSTPTTPTTNEAQGCASLIRNFGRNLSQANQKSADESLATRTSAESVSTTKKRASAQDASANLASSSAIRAQSAVPENRVDVALAEPMNPAIFRNDILNIGRITGTAQPYLGQQLRKTGRTTGYTTGRVTLINATIDVAYNTPWGTKTARFTGQVITTGMSQGGDSGSLVVALNTQEAVGLLFAGSGVASVFTPIDVVMQYGQFYFG